MARNPMSRLPIREARAPVAQLDRASDYESEGRTFESFRARQLRAASHREAARCVSAAEIEAIGLCDSKTRDPAPALPYGP